MGSVTGRGYLTKNDAVDRMEAHATFSICHIAARGPPRHPACISIGSQVRVRIRAGAATGAMWCMGKMGGMRAASATDGNLVYDPSSPACARSLLKLNLLNPRAAAP
jgi:hypothetical protein